MSSALELRLSARRCQAEMMDDPHLPEAEHRRALAGLARLNWISGAGRVLWEPIRRLAQEVSPKPLRVLDLASGSGDGVLALWRQAQRVGLTNLELAGTDISPRAIEVCREQARRIGATSIDWFPLDVQADPLPHGYDVITCSQFFHHLDDASTERLLARMADAAGRMVLVVDLERSQFNWWLVAAGTWLFGWSKVVRVDGRRSIEAALSLREFRQLAETAGLRDSHVERLFPSRMRLSWTRP